MELEEATALWILLKESLWLIVHLWKVIASNQNNGFNSPADIQSPISDIRTVEGQTSLLKSNQKTRMTLSSSTATDKGIPTIIWKISSTYSSLLQRWGWFRPGMGSVASLRDCSISVLIFKRELVKNLTNLLYLWNYQTSTTKKRNESIHTGWKLKTEIRMTALLVIHYTSFPVPTPRKSLGQRCAK